jgi:hydantoinase/carbamoylase family amidase
LSAFVELHIEQGPVLEDRGIDIGVVSGIVGVRRWTARFEGQANHAGTTPMGLRRDALAAAAEVVLGIEELAAGDRGVGTAGRIEVLPGATNVVPGLATLWLELRSIDAEWLSQRAAELEALVTAVGRRRGVVCQLDEVSRDEPTPLHAGVSEVLAGAARRTGLQHMVLASGAEHDTRHMAAIAPAGMLFVPSQKGLSHAPGEWTDPAHLSEGTAALTSALVGLDAGRHLE